MAKQAEALRKVVFPSCMATALGLDLRIGPAGYQRYLEQLLLEAGSPSDPIERMMVEQLALAHFRVGQLHVGAAQAKSVEVVKLYNSATARLLGEFRRTALALRDYRGSGTKKRDTDPRTAKTG